MAPVIIIGMHRSGTSLASWLLQSCGLYVGGGNYPRTNENPFFVQLNSWVLRQCGVDWDLDDPVPSLMQCAPAADLMTDALSAAMRSPWSIRYLGWRGYLKHRNVTALNAPWGWKDPRSTLTLPLWMRLFPDARVVHVTRHGVDVAESLRARWERHSLARVEHYRRRLPLYIFRRKRIGVFYTRCAEPQQGLNLWAQYMRAAQNNLLAVPAHQRLQIRYEDLLSDPLPELRRLARFCGLPTDQHRIAQAIDQHRLNDARAYAHRQDPDLRALAHANAGLLADHAYDAPSAHMDAPASPAEGADNPSAATWASAEA